VDFVPGCFMLINASRLRQVGFLNESFYIYFEEADISLRAWKKGFPSGLIPHFVAGHQKSITNVRWSPFYTYFFLRNFMILARLHARLSECKLCISLNVFKKTLAYAGISLFKGLFKGGFFRNLRAVILAFHDFLFSKELPVRYKHKEK
jgi:GT2 family glycosyltransferase